jgi:MFS family permease
VILFLVGGSAFGMWFFLTLYLQEVLGYSPLKAGVTFLPMTLSIVVGATIASRIMARVGAKRLLVLGLLGLSAGLLLFSRITTAGGYLNELLVPGLLAGLGMSFAFVPGTICATSGVAPQEAGLASALANSFRLVGGGLGLAVLAAIATAHTTNLLHHPTAAVHTLDQALVSGFKLAFLIAAGFALVGAAVAAFAMPNVRARAAAAGAKVTPAVEG